ncbi:MAG: hypothetical protein ACPGXK_05465 [Phycisphaerae bacterium]
MNSPNDSHSDVGPVADGVVDQTGHRSGGAMLSWLGLALVIGGPVAYYSMQDQTMLRSTGMLAWILMFGGVALALMGMTSYPRRLTRLLFGSCLSLTVLFLLFFFVASALPKAQQRSLDMAPDFEVLDHGGASVRLTSLLASGPVHLVFYRGHW